MLAVLAVLTAGVVVAGAALLGRRAGEWLYETRHPDGRMERARGERSRARRLRGAYARWRYDRELPPIPVSVEVDHSEWRERAGSSPEGTSVDPERDAVSALRILQGAPLELSVEEHVLLSRASTRTLRALMQRPGLYEQTQAAAALHLAGRGVRRHTLIEDRYLEAAHEYRESLRNWPQRRRRYAELGEIEENVEHLLQLLDPTVRETYLGIAAGWNGDVDSAIGAAHHVLTA